MISTAPVSKLHIYEIVQKLREYERLGDPENNLEFVMRQSIFTQSIFFNGELGVVWGLQTKSLVDEIGYIWMLTTQVIDRNKKAFLRRSKRITAEALTACPIIRCHCDARYVKSHQWLIWLGFNTIGMETLYEHPFWIMELRA